VISRSIRWANEDRRSGFHGGRESLRRAAGASRKKRSATFRRPHGESARARINHRPHPRGCGRCGRAESSYRQIIDAASILGYSTVITGARWKLAEVLIKKGNTAGAKEQLDALLKQWEKADTEFTLLKKVREERKKLE
jgi:hypothetical protein